TPLMTLSGETSPSDVFSMMAGAGWLGGSRLSVTFALLPSSSRCIWGCSMDGGCYQFRLPGKSNHRKVEFLAFFGAVRFGIEELVGDIEADKSRVLHFANEQEGVGLAHEDESFFHETGLAVGERGAVEPGLEGQAFEGVNIADVKTHQ